eukprot:CAMPEP_0180124792 /NCGR_PEP_ID=MMETSP0986-20121125/4840_1 /TAXON_ID=697907 /ORGANISM="non described non described, Strain CCMP2293" /LENGTH=187 /DNA_ID=CAMNT_0022064155 /DNA_START=303 /DNA_END=867 /DNA_ORIENTATION=-
MRIFLGLPAPQGLLRSWQLRDGAFGGIPLRPRFDQRIHCLEQTELERERQRGGPVLRPKVDVRPLLDQKLDDFRAPHLDGHVHGSRAIPSPGGVHVGAGCDQVLHDLNPPVLRREVKRRHLLDGAGIDFRARRDQIPTTDSLPSCAARRSGVTPFAEEAFTFAPSFRSRWTTSRCPSSDAARSALPP